jgi:hypothetical protein
MGGHRGGGGGVGEGVQTGPSLTEWTGRIPDTAKPGQARVQRRALLADVNHGLVALSALSFFVVLLHGDRLIIFCEGDGPGAR